MTEPVSKREATSGMRYYFQCPRCGNDGEFLRPSDGANSTGCAIFFLGGFLPALLFDSYMKRRVQCLKCLHLFQQPPIPSSPLANFAGVLQVLIILLVATAIVLHLSPGLTEVWPAEVPILAMVEDAIAAQPRTTAYLLVAFVVSVSVSTVIAAFVGNLGLRRQLAKQFQLKPPTSLKAVRGGDAEEMKPPKHVE